MIKPKGVYTLRSKVARITGVREVEILEEDVTVRPGHLLVRNLCGAINIGTTIHLYRGEETHRFPREGYGFECEAVAEVTEVGEGVTGYEVGDTIQNMGSEGARQFSATTPETSMHIPEGVDLEEASFIEQMRVALNAVRRAHIVLGDSVLIVGCGIIGIAAMQLAKLAGAEQVIVSDPVDMKLEIAKNLGADVVINPAKENLIERVRKVTEARRPPELKSPNHLLRRARTFPTIHLLEGPKETKMDEGVDVVIDAANSPRTLQEDFQACRRFGRIVFLTYLANVPIEKLYLGRDFHMKQIELISSQIYVQYPGDFQHSMRWTPTANYGYLYELLKKRKLKMRDIITHRFDLEEIGTVFEIMDQHPEDMFGVIIRP